MDNKLREKCSRCMYIWKTIPLRGLYEKSIIEVKTICSSKVN